LEKKEKERGFRKMTASPLSLQRKKKKGILLLYRHRSTRLRLRLGEKENLAKNEFAAL